MLEHVTTVGVESSHGFGDCVFNLPLMRAISQKHNTKVDVAVTSHCADAFYNIPWVNKIIHIPNMHHGIERFKSMNYEYIYQITQNIRFFDYTNSDPQHSLIDTPLFVGRDLGLPDFDQRPIFIPTDEEENVGATYTKNNRRTIAIECIAKSGQSWADIAAINMILDMYMNDCNILWLSNQGAPDHKNVDNLLRYSRREIITLLRHCDIFFSVGSGFFCASLGLPEHLQPKKIVCLWIDGFYRYEKRLSELKFHKDIIWVHNHQELQDVIKQ